MKIHSLSDVQSQEIGENTTIWQYCVVLAGAKIGYNCNICSHCFIENNVIIGDNVTIKNGVHIFDFTYIQDNVFIGPNVTFTNDSYPVSRRGEKLQTTEYTKTIIGRGASIGGGATILPGIKIGEDALIGAGSVVTKDVLAGQVVLGNPAKFMRTL